MVIKHVGIKHNLGRSKVKLAHAVRKRLGIIEENPVGRDPPSESHTSQSKESHVGGNTKHELNLIALMLFAGGIGWYLFR